MYADLAGSFALEEVELVGSAAAWVEGFYVHCEEWDSSCRYQRSRGGEAVGGFTLAECEEWSLGRGCLGVGGGLPVRVRQIHGGLHCEGKLCNTS